MAFAIRQEKAAVFKTFSSESGQEQIRVSVINVRSNHAARAKVQPQLNGNEHNGKQNADQRHRKAYAVMEQISNCERQDHLKNLTNRGVGFTARCCSAVC